MHAHVSYNNQVVEEEWVAAAAEDEELTREK